MNQRVNNLNIVLGAWTLLGAKGIATRSKDATRSKEAIRLGAIAIRLEAIALRLEAEHRLNMLQVVLLSLLEQPCFTAGSSKGIWNS